MGLLVFRRHAELDELRHGAFVQHQRGVLGEGKHVHDLQAGFPLAGDTIERGHSGNGEDANPELKPGEASKGITVKRMKTVKLMRMLCEEAGSELVEFSLAALIFVTTVVGIADLSRAMYAYHFVTYASQQAARFAATRGSSWSSACTTVAPPSFAMKFQCNASTTDMTNFVKSISVVNNSNITVTTTWPGTTANCSSSCSACTTTNSPGCMVKVKVNYSFRFASTLWHQTTVNLYATAQNSILQ
ncbi:MAG: TadE/TadG family type IV pilus assembly protein [Bryobacteraceae bacterium]